MYNTLLIKRRLLTSANNSLPILSGGELAYSEKTSEWYYGSGAPGEEVTLPIGGRGAYVTTNNPGAQDIFGEKHFHGATTLSGATFKDQVIVTGQLQASAVYVTSNLTVDHDVLIKGNLTVEGLLTQIDTEVTVTSAMDITNLGTGPALTVTQLGDEAIAAFYDDSNAVALYVDGHTARAGNVGIGTDQADSKLTVLGSISASGGITAFNPTFNGETKFNTNVVVTTTGSVSGTEGVSMLEGFIIVGGEF